MVIPVTGPHIPINLGETKKFVGNNLKLDFPQNRCTILVIGNNCSLNISENFGAVKVIGNNCVVHIDECVGSVHYIGNNGSVALEGNTSRADCVTYTGTNGSITAKKSSAKSEESTSASSTGKEAHLFQTADSAIVIRNNVRIKNPCVTLDIADIDQFFQVTVASV